VLKNSAGGANIKLYLHSFIIHKIAYFLV